MNTIVKNERITVDPIDLSKFNISVGLIFQHAESRNFYLVYRTIATKESLMDLYFVDINSGKTCIMEEQYFIDLVRDGLYIPVKSCTISNVKYFEKEENYG